MITGFRLGATPFCAARRTVANVVTASPGVQVENVSAGEGRHGTNGPPGSFFSGGRLACPAVSRAGFGGQSAGSAGTCMLPSMTASATLRIVSRRSMDVFWIQRNAAGSLRPCSD